jgi:hypothetical protein
MKSTFITLYDYLKKVAPQLLQLSVAKTQLESHDHFKRFELDFSPLQDSVKFSSHFHQG